MKGRGKLDAASKLEAERAEAYRRIALVRARQVELEREIGVLRSAVGICKPPVAVGCSSPPLDVFTGATIDHSNKGVLADRAVAVRVLGLAIGWRSREVEALRIQVQDGLAGLGWHPDAAPGSRGAAQERAGAGAGTQMAPEAARAS